MKSPNFLSGIIATIVAGIILFWLEPWVKPQTAATTGHSLLAEVRGGPWVPFPVSGNSSVERGWLRQGFSEMLIDEAKQGDPWGFAQIVIRNTGTARAESIRFDLGEYPPEVVVTQLPGSDLERYERPRQVSLGALEPGQTASIYFWHDLNLSAPSYYSAWQTFSSVGPASFSFPASEETTFTEYIVRSPEFPWIVGGLGAIFLLVVIGSTADAWLRERYARRLLSEGGFYEDEQARFAGDPARFRPTLTQSANT